MREEHGVHPIDLGLHELQTQLRRRVDEDDLALVRLDSRTDPRSLVARVARMADRAAAAKLRNAEARPGSEESELHGMLIPSRPSSSSSYQAHRTAHPP